MELVFIKDGQPCTNSRLVAWKFGKEHKNVIRDIKNLECSEEFGRLNFEPSSYINDQNREMPEYIITQDGFAFLVMGFTGKQAAKFKEEYINSFNTMRAELSKPKSKEELWLEAMKTLALEVESQKMELVKVRRQVEVQMPKVELVDRAMMTDRLVDVGQTAKLLKLPYGRNTLFKRLREKGIFFKHKNEPKQIYVNNGCFELKEKVITKPNGEDMTVIKVWVTQKGLLYIHKILGGTSPSWEKSPVIQKNHRHCVKSQWR